ncbi:adhesin, partial [Pseudomonas capsici]
PTTTQGGVIQAQRLSLTALGGFDNYGGRVSASTGEALLTTANLDNRNGGIYAKGRVRVIGNDLDNSGDNDGQIAGGQVDLQLTGALNNRLGIIESDSRLAIKAASLDNRTGQIRSLGTSDAADFQIGTLFDNRNGTVEVANSNLILNAASFLNANGKLLHAGAGTFDISTANLTQAGGNLVTRGGLTITADNWTNSSVIQAGRLTVNVGTLNQTASGQLLASSALVGTGGSWTNEGLIASDGTLELTLTGKYASNGQTTSLGRLGLSAASVELFGTGRIAGASDVQVKSGSMLFNQGRITSARDLTLNATSLTNNGTIGSAGKLDLVSQVLRNEGASSGDQSLISSGGDMRLLVGDFTNRFATVYSLGGLLVAGDAALNRSNRIDNISAVLQSSGAMGLYGTTISNRKDAFSVSEQVVSGTITYQCLNCKGRHYDFFYYVTEEIARSVQADSASSSINAGGALKVQSSLFENKHSTVSASSSIDIATDNFNNEGASTESVLRTRQFRNPDDAEGSDIWFDMVREGGVIAEYAKYNSKTQFVYLEERNNGDGGVDLAPVWSGAQDTGIANPFYRSNSGYAVPAHVLTYWLYDSWETQTNTGVAANAVIQAGGAVNIAASKNLGNGVTRQNTGYSSLALSAANTQTGSQINPNTASINAQLSPDLAQQQVNPLTLPGFSLPTGQNGLFRLSAQTSNSTAATQATGAPQNWTLGSASVSVAQREQTVSDTQARTLKFGTTGQVSTATRQLADVVRQNSGLSANASAFDSSTPVDSATRLQLTGHSTGNTGLTQVADVTQVQSQNGPVPFTPVASNDTTVQNGTTTPTAVPNTQVARVQALPGNTAPPNPHKYLIETNPVLTDLRQFMSSDYLLAGLGYDPEASAKRLGDGLYEQRLVQQAIVARTGQAFLAGQTSNEAQLKYLMNNAIASKEQLNLTIGVELSSLQVAALTHDIVWLEEHEVNGEKVLVPVLYLAQANNRLAPNGALIAGNDVTLTAGENLDNVGTLRATNNLSATAGNDLVNVGLIEAGNRLDLLAGNDLVNKAGGILYGRDVTLSATRGDVINERTVTRAVGAEGYQDFADSAARIESVNDLTIKAGRDMQNIGGTLQAGRDLSLIAGRDLNIGAAQTETSKVQGANTQSSITQLGASVSVGRDLMAISGRDINVVASDIDAK